MRTEKGTFSKGHIMLTTSNALYIHGVTYLEKIINLQGIFS